MKTPIINGVRVSVHDVANDVWLYGRDLKQFFTREELDPDDPEAAGGDIRLQVVDGSWRTWEGDSQFDTDHRGAWASAFVPYGCTRKQSQEIARQLVEECE